MGNYPILKKTCYQSFIFAYACLPPVLIYNWEHFIVWLSLLAEVRKDRYIEGEKLQCRFRRGQKLARSTAFGIRQS